MSLEDSNTDIGWAARTTRSVVEEAATASERGVLEVGKALGNLVQESRTQTSDLLEVLPRLEGDAAGDHAGIRQAIDRQTATVTSFVQDLMSRADRQNQLADHAARLTEGIAALARDVSGIAIKARLLSLNARIECSRLGESGKAMTVVATEIRQVSASVAKANADIAELAAQLTDLLPNVARLSSELQETSHSFRESFAESQTTTQTTYAELMGFVKTTVERSQQRAERMLNESRNALSALNFQDPMVQALRELATMIERRSNGERVSETRLGIRDHSANDDDGSKPAAGEVALF